MRMRTRVLLILISVSDIYMIGEQGARTWTGTGEQEGGREKLISFSNSNIPKDTAILPKRKRHHHSSINLNLWRVNEVNAGETMREDTQYICSMCLVIVYRTNILCSLQNGHRVNAFWLDGTCSKKG